MKLAPNKIQIEVLDEKVGAIQTDQVNQKGKIIAIGSNVDPKFFQVGKTLYLALWACYIITDGQKKYHFVDKDSEAICAVQ